MGAWSTAVLNLNNLRDVENDAQMQKRTVVVMLGYVKGKIYHVFLVATGLATWFFTIYLLAVRSRNC
jgi:1,4-dihydroxy-2-naphthoate octaprenyltransferase